MFSTMERGQSCAHGALVWPLTCFLNLSALRGTSRNVPEGAQERGGQGFNPGLNPEPSQAT